MKTCIIIPTYNESKEIGNIVKQLRDNGLDVLVVDDGSSDTTVAIARANGALVLENSQNEGKGASLIKGFDYCLANGFDAVVTMDGDGQHNPSNIAYFLDSANNDAADIIVGNRMHRTKNMPLIRWMTNMFMSWLISLICKQRIADTQCGFRLIKRRVLENIRFKCKKYEIESEILIKAARHGYKIVSVNIESIYRGERSQINPLIDTLRFIRFIFSELWITIY